MSTCIEEVADYEKMFQKAMEKLVLMQFVIELDKQTKLIEKTRSSLFVLHLEENRLYFLLNMTYTANKKNKSVSQGPIISSFHLQLSEFASLLGGR